MRPPLSTRSLLLALALASVWPDAASAINTCYCGNGRSIKTARDCSSACEGMGGARHWNDKDREKYYEGRRQRYEEWAEQSQDDADLRRALEARGAATRVVPRRSPPATPQPTSSKVTNVDTKRPLDTTKGVACLDGKVLIPKLPTREQIVFCKSQNK